MTEQQRKDAVEYIMGQLDYDYIDLGIHDKDELEIVKEAMALLIYNETYFCESIEEAIEPRHFSCPADCGTYCFMCMEDDKCD